MGGAFWVSLCSGSLVFRNQRKSAKNGGRSALYVSILQSKVIWGHCVVDFAGRAAVVCGGVGYILVGMVWLAPELDSAWGLWVLLMMLGVRMSMVTGPTMAGGAKLPGRPASAVEENRKEESNRGAGLDLKRTLVTCRREKETCRETKGISFSSKQPSDFLSSVLARVLGRSALLTAVELCLSSLATLLGAFGTSVTDPVPVLVVPCSPGCIFAQLLLSTAGLQMVSPCSVIVLH